MSQYEWPGNKLWSPGLQKYLDGFRYQISGTLLTGDLKVFVNEIELPKPELITIADVMTETNSDVFLRQAASGVMQVSCTWRIAKENIRGEYQA